MERYSCGYRIQRVGDELRFESARAGAFWGWFVALLVLGIVAANAIIQAVMGNPRIAGVLAAVATALGLAALLIWRARRRKAPESPVDFVIKLPAGELIDASGQRLCAATQLTWSTRFDPFDSTRGFMYFLVMHWPGGSARVFKDGGCGGVRQQLVTVRDEIQAQLAQHGP